MSQLSKDILGTLIKKTGKAVATIRKDLSILRRKYPQSTLNAVASIYARQHGFSIMQKLKKEDKTTLPQYEVIAPKNIMHGKSKKASLFLYLKFETNNKFYNKHILEINKAYNAGCYTSVNVLLRKIIENVIIDILRHKYPPDDRSNKILYYNIDRKSYQDFSIVLKNLYDKRNDFDTLKKQIERLYDLCKNFKDDANDKTHSLYHIVERREEIDELHVDTIIELAKGISSDIGLNLFL
jgi:hypothetical protein